MVVDIVCCSVVIVVEVVVVDVVVVVVLDTSVHSPNMVQPGNTVVVVAIVTVVASCVVRGSSIKICCSCRSGSVLALQSSSAVATSRLTLLSHLLRR